MIDVAFLFSFLIFLISYLTFQFSMTRGNIVRCHGGVGRHGSRSRFAIDARTRNVAHVTYVSCHMEIDARSKDLLRCFPHVDATFRRLESKQHPTCSII
jgi:hypothetical protein